MNYKTEQEKYWAEKFGDDYIKRNRDLKIVSSNIRLFSEIFKFLYKPPEYVLELGANIGLNLIAIKQLIPSVQIDAVEINEKAYKELKKLKFISNVWNKSILEFTPSKKYDFVFTKGVLIHINPEFLEIIYKIIYEASSCYICIIEYYNPTPVEIEYRGKRGLLFKRDFAGEFLDMFKDVKLVHYGFIYHRDNIFPQDDITWFLLKK